MQAEADGGGVAESNLPSTHLYQPPGHDGGIAGNIGNFAEKAGGRFVASHKAEPTVPLLPLQISPFWEIAEFAISQNGETYINPKPSQGLQTLEIGKKTTEGNPF
jgi:hypothetical protein